MITRQDIPALTGIRFFAAFAILMNHLLLGVVPRNEGLIAYTASRCGTLGMNIFFVLSGFLIHYIYNDKLRLLNIKDLFGFFVARVARLYPLYIMCFFFTIIATGDTYQLGSEKFSQILPSTVLMMHSWTFVRLDGKLIAQILPSFSLAWSISTEMLMYLLYPLVLWSFRGVQLRRTIDLALTAVLILLLSVLIAQAWKHLGALDLWISSYRAEDESLAVAGSDSFIIWLLFISPYGRLPEFLIGVLVAHAYLRTEPITPTRPERIAGSVLFVAAILWLSGYLFPLEMDPFQVNAGCHPAIALIIFCCARYHDQWFSRLISLKPLVILGASSYGIYLLQFYVADLFPGMYDGLRLPAVLAFWLTLAGIAYLSFTLIERPAQRSIRQFGAKLVLLPERWRRSGTNMVRHDRTNAELS